MRFNRCEQATRSLTVDQMLELIRNSPPGPWPLRQEWRNGKHFDVPEDSWHCWDNTQEAMRILAMEYVENLPPYPNHYEGRGIITAGGGGKYLPCVWVCVNKLRHVGCKLPIQVWYLGEQEMDPYFKRLLAALDVKCIDAREVCKHIPYRILCGWELKLYAILHCPFKEVVFLDSDNHALSNPESLFEEEAYKAKGAIFWPDYDYWTLDENLFRIFGIHYVREPAFESGQAVIHKSQSWRGLLMASWYAEHSDFVFKHVYGDKECFHLGWRKAGMDYAMPRRGPTWQCESVIVQHGMDGKPLFLHRVQDKWKLHGGNRRCHLPDEDLHHNMAQELRRIWSGKMWSNPVPNEREKEAIAKLCHHKFLYRRLATGGFKGDERVLELLPGSRIGEGEADCEARWEINEVLTRGKATMTLSICSSDKLTANLTLQDGVWKGKWVDHEKCDVELVPLDTPVQESILRDLRRLTQGISGTFRKHGYNVSDDTIRKLVNDVLGDNL